MIKILAIAMLMIGSAYAGEKNQCGERDSRELSFDRKVARMLKQVDSKYGCTGTLIGRTCMISAGHCESYAKINEFNTPPSKTWKIVHSDPKDIYELHKVIGARSGGRGNDWMVYRLKANKITGLYPGDAQGMYSVSLRVPAAPSEVSITGYGSDRRSTRNYAQQMSANLLTQIDGTTLRHKVDTQGGSSGSAIINVSSQKIIGIHTHGGCSDYHELGTNVGTIIAGHKELMLSIEKCLVEESNLE